MDKETSEKQFCQGLQAQESILEELSKIGTVIDCSKYSNEEVADLLRRTINQSK
ncbi:MAG: hypothetical protein ACE3JK_18860 [Sporolactobacillus sp.]